MATPPRPTADTIISSAWGTAVHDMVFAQSYKTLTGQGADANGLFTVTAVQLGLSAISGLVWNVYAGYNPTGQAVQPIPGFAFKVSATSYILPIHYYNKGTGTMIPAANFNGDLYVHAWGTAAATRDEPELLPGPDDDRPELNPQQES